jgi:DNA-binding MarR family transcriptional regulator
MLRTFRAFKAAGDYRRRHLLFLKTLEDQDLVREIGLGQALGHPLSLKQLFAHGIGSIATVQRRLARLRRLGIVSQTKADSDRRVVKLTLTPAARKLYVRWGREIRKSWK